MSQITETISLNSIDQLPSIETLRKIPRDKKIKLHFEGVAQNQRLTIGNELKNELVGFQVSINSIEPEINICKLITDDEVELNQIFFEQCAKDYTALARKLIFRLADKLDLTIDSDFPLLTFNPLKNSKKQIGTIEDWRYFLHGFHCGFENKKSGQVIEVPLVFGLDFGDLDPYFFTKFIKSTKEYDPLPTPIYEDYADGAQINKKMVDIGKFERISSNIENHFGIAVKDRTKVKIDVYKDKTMDI